MPAHAILTTLLQLVLKDRSQLALENIALRQQLAVGKRTIRSRWQNAYVERVIGTLRRECTDHVIPLNEHHLLRTLREYVSYYNESRAHSSLEGNAPELRAVEEHGDVVATPVLGGLHQRY